MRNLNVLVLLTVIGGCYLDGVVFEITENNFDEYVDEHRRMMTLFYVPNCEDCQKMEQIIEMFIQRSEFKKTGIAVTKMDCSENAKPICNKYGVEGFPSFKYINRIEEGVDFHMDHKSNRTLDDLLLFMYHCNKEHLRELSSEEALEFVQAHTQQVVMGFFKDKASALFKKLAITAGKHINAYKFGYTFSVSAAVSLGISMDSIMIYRQKHLRSKSEDESLVTKSVDTLDEFLKANQYAVVDFRNPDNQDVFEAEKHVVLFVAFNYVLQVPRMRRIRTALLRVAQLYPQVRILFSKRSDYKHFVSGFAPTAHLDDIHVVAYNTPSEKYLLPKPLRDENITSFESAVSTFIGSFLKGEIEPYIKSQPIPVKKKGFVTDVVAKNFESIVLDASKDVLIEIYANWCQHCKDFAPAYEKLAEILSKEDKLVVARIDGSENEHHPAFPIEGYPTVYLAKAGEKDKPLKYAGEMKVESLFRWLKVFTTHPIKVNVSFQAVKNEL